MDDQGVGLIAWILIAVVGLVAAVGVAGGVMYANDTAVGAKVVDKECKGSLLSTQPQSSVTIETQFPVPGIVHTVEQVDNNACHSLTEGRSFIEYHIQSGRTILYESQGGKCLYDTADKLC